MLDNNKKESNPKAAYGDTKVGLSSLPFGPIYEMALAMTEGGLKYGKHNYRKIGCRASTYFDAAIGHLVSWYEGEDFDEASGIHHLMKAVASLIVIRDCQLMGNAVDDRPIKYPEGVPLRKNPLLKHLLAKYPNPVEPFTEMKRLSKLLPPVPVTKPMAEKDRRRIPSDLPACEYCKVKFVCNKHTTKPAGMCDSYEPRRVDRDRRRK